MDKLKVYHFNHGGGGGVWSVIKNLIQFSHNPAIENHIVHAINTKLFPHYSIEPMQGAVTEQLCFYSPNDNFYHTCKKLAACLPNEKALVAAHDWVELGMMSNLGLQNKVVNFLHGDFEYYYSLAEKHQQSIDAFICISPTIFENLKTKLSNSRNSIYKCYFPVAEGIVNKKSNDEFNIVYAVRDLCEARKNFSILKDIAHALTDVQVHWHIAGGMSDKDSATTVLNALPRHTYHGELATKDVLQLFSRSHVFLLPSSKEGLPVALVEAMKCGVVPIVPDWDSATKEFLKEGEHGFYVEFLDVEKYAATIRELSIDREKLNSMAVNCILSANKIFNPYANTKTIEDLFIQTSKQPYAKKLSKKIYGSRLDEKYIPNLLVSALRKLKD